MKWEKEGKFSYTIFYYLLFHFRQAGFMLATRDDLFAVSLASELLRGELIKSARASVCES